MDGYSVQEAASVLGVAEGRVWELLARGVLLGTPEGDSMRVFLKGQPGPIANAASRDEPPRTNGNGGTNGGSGEASAFRELLNEFRNLTERYGQALLALGEARGEVAGLRSRVDQLETRLDLRMPPPIDAAPVAWESATIPAAAPEAAVTPRPVAPAQPKPRSRKPRTSREAVAGFADALARAQDPSAAELRQSREEDAAAAESTAEAIADAFSVEEPIEAATDTPLEEAPADEAVAEAVAEPAAEEPLTEAVVEESVAAAVSEEPITEAVVEESVAAAVREEPITEAVAEASAAEAIAHEPAPAAAAEAIPEEPVADAVAEEPAPEAAAEPEPPTYSAVVVEPDWFADGDFAWLDAADRDAPGVTEASAAAADVTTEPDLSEPELAAATTDIEPSTTGTAEEAAESVEPPAAAAPEEPPSGMVAQEPEPVPEPLPPEPQPEPEPVPSFEAETEFESWQPPQTPAQGTGGATAAGPAAAGPAAAGPAAAGPAEGASDAPERQTMSSAVAVEEFEEEVMWLGAEPTTVVEDEPRPEPRAELMPWPTVDSAPPVTDVVRPPLAMTEDELARLALDEGWDESEVAAIRAMITPIPTATVDLPGAAELHDAMAALEAVPVRSDPRYDVSRQWSKPAPAEQPPPHHDDWAFEAEPAPPPATPPATQTPRPPNDVTAALRRAVADPGWLRRRQGPAAAAYRRLRRLFPG